MSPLSFIVIAFMLALVAMSFAFAGGAVIVALPIAVLVIGAIAGLEFRRRIQQQRTMRDFREQAKTSKVDFDERDRQTLTSE
jgi:hypothetical protein